MKIRTLLACVLLGLLASHSRAAQPEALRLVQTISLPPSPIFDHLAIDRVHRRAYLTASANRAIYVVDLKEGKWIKTIGGVGKPAGIAYHPKLDRVMYSVDSGHYRFMDPNTFEVETEITLAGGADCMRWDPVTDTIYVNNGGPQLEDDHVILSTIDVKTRKVTNEMNVPATRLEFISVEGHGSRLFICNVDANQITVVDRNEHKIIANWDLPAKVPYPSTLNEKLHRLFVVTREPAMLVVFNTDTGKQVAQLPVSGGCDDIALDTVEKRLYLTGGADGMIDVIQVKDADTYVPYAQIKTQIGARTSTWVQEEARLYVPLPAKAPVTTSELRVYESIR